jgi:hypothetical protein
MQRVTVAAVAVGIALFAAFARNPSSTAGAAMPAPTPVAMQYEEIGRFVISGTPPPPGSFQNDRAAVIAAESTPAPSHGLFAGIQNSVNQAMSTVKSLQTGILTRYTYYNNWVRTDDVANETAVIIKCDLRQYISLDLAHHTYKIASTVPSQSPMPSAAAAPYAPGPATSSAPGTMDLTLTGSRQSLGPQTLDGIRTQGESSEMSMAMTNATGSCKNGSFSMSLTEYISNIHVPRPHCPVPHVRVPSSPQEWVTRSGGCTPRIHESGSGGGLMNEGDRLAMYRLMSIGGGDASGRAFKTVTEAGNVRWLEKPDADQLFAIPEGFTQQQ